MSSFSEYAEFILRSPDLQSKLTPPPDDLKDSIFRDDSGLSSYDSIPVPELPGREKRIQLTNEKTKIPRLEHLNDTHNIAISLHHFANHELMAIELFAWAILKFPNAPTGTRKGFLISLKEEQDHFRAYQSRMEELGLGFGERPLNQLFWKQVPKMQTLEKFAAILSISFEGANLDFAQIYKQAFLFHGDTKSAEIMEKIFEDEIRHVKRGLAIFQKSKPKGMEDWDYYTSLLEYPLTPRRAKAYFFIPESRKLAGFSDSFIEKLGSYSDIYTGRVNTASLEKVGISNSIKI